MKTPAISVVTSVYNGERYLRRSMLSVLAQRDVDFEVIAINDGSTDSSGEILDRLATGDSRLRVIHQGNEGLTQALIRGCSEARGELIARHDSDDESLPGRLVEQADALSAKPERSFVSCWSEAVGPEDEPLFEVVGEESDESALEALSLGLQGPAGHGSVMMRQVAYEHAGGYRAQFRYAQDWDLWLRLAELGSFHSVPGKLYRYRITETAISGRRRDLQEKLFRIALMCRDRRKEGRAESDLLEEARRISHAPDCSSRGYGTNAYFIGKCLLDKRDRRARGYFARELRQRPLYARAWLGWLAASVLPRTDEGRAE